MIGSTLARTAAAAGIAAGLGLMAAPAALAEGNMNDADGDIVNQQQVGANTEDTGQSAEHESNANVDASDNIAQDVEDSVNGAGQQD